jgi:type VI secretion system protein ImpA
MPLRNDLLNPISPEKPSGDNLRYDPLYDKIKEARREDDEITAAYTGERKLADWPLVIRLISDALATKTKDLQLVAWLAEAMLKREGAAGLREVLDLARGFLDNFWDTFYPEIDEGDLEPRSAPLQWIGESETILKAVRLTPITAGKFNAIQWRQSRTVPTEEAAAGTYATREQRQIALAEGKIPPEVADKDFLETTKQFFFDKEKEFDGLLESLKQLSKTCDAKFEEMGHERPSFITVQKEIEDVRSVVHSFLMKKRETDPDPVEPGAQPGTESGADSTGGTATAGRVVVADLSSWEGAVAQTVATAKYMRQQNPYNPASFLMLRGLRWGELRADGRIDPRKLAGPPADLRQDLKRQALSGEWKQALETAETAMGLECGRGWLDIQRYVVAACDELGGYYQPVRGAVISELKALLQDFPNLPEMTLLDDMPTAGTDTRAWIDNCVVSQSEEQRYAADGIRGSPNPQIFEIAVQAVRKGRPEAAVELLLREISRDPSGRGRFQRRIQAAQLCISSGNEAVALSILKNAAAEIEEKKLEEWEAPETLAYPLIMYYRCLVRTEDTYEDRDKLFSWICRLDPVEAMKLEK